MELHGLRMIVSDAVERGNVHVIAGPPDPDAPQAEWDRYWRKQCWTAKVEEAPASDAQ